MNSNNRKAYFVGGGIGSLAAAAFMIRDGGMAGDHITVFEAGSVMGGSLDGSGDAKAGYIVRGSRMLTTARLDRRFIAPLMTRYLVDGNSKIHALERAFGSAMHGLHEARLPPIGGSRQ
jgi:oleate hydratase